jgi:uncharacterized protein (TIGR00255 family)
MTGFGAASRQAGAVRVSAEIRSVNHRFFNPSIKLPATMVASEGMLRDLLRQRITRGHVTLMLRLEADQPSGALINSALFARYTQQLRALAASHDFPTPELSTVLRMPGVVESVSEADGSADPDLLNEVVGDAIAALDAMRLAEGANMSDYLSSRLALFSAAVDRIEKRAPTRLHEATARMRGNVSDLLQGLALDEQRVAQEIAMLADRIDISEELGRLRSHLTAFGDSLRATADEPVGKRLGFLLQEMLREVNTIGSKAADASILGDVVLLKEELERLREQAENIE